MRVRICSSVTSTCSRSSPTSSASTRSLHAVAWAADSAGRTHSLPHGARRHPTGQVDPALAVPVGDQRVDARTWARRSSAPAGQPGATGAASRSTRRRSAPGGSEHRHVELERRAPSPSARRPCAARSTCDARQAAQRVERVGVARAAGRRLGRAPRRARARAAEHLGPRTPAAHACADPGPGVRAGRRCAGRPTASGPARRTPRGVARGARRAAAAVRGRATRRHPGQRPGARAAGQPEQHRLGLVVEGVAEQDGARRRCVRRPRPARRTGPRGPPPRARRERADRPRRRACDRLEAPSPAMLRRRPARRRSAEPACSPWSTSPPPTRSPARGASTTRRRGQRQRVGAAGAGDQHQRRRAARRSTGRRPLPRAAHRGDRDGGPVRRRRSAVDAGVTQARGSAISAWRRQGLGRGPDRVEAVHADLVDDGADERARRRGTAPS